jgi:hypothetical protein
LYSISINTLKTAFFHRRQSETESGTNSQFAFTPYLSMMMLDNLSAQIKTQTSARVKPRALSSLPEALEQLGPIMRGNTPAGVGDRGSYAIV